MERRTFLGGFLGAGALVATSSLPARGEDKPSVFPSRGRFERLSVSISTVEIGLQKPFSVLHISDTHLTAAYPHESESKQMLCKCRTETFGGMQEAALRDSLDWAKSHTEFVVHTGDLIDWQSEANFDLVKKYFGSGVCGCVGNHEFSPDMWLSDPAVRLTEEWKDRFRGRLHEIFQIDVVLQSRVVNGVNFVAMDDVFGYVTKTQVERFAAEVAKGLPIVLCMHVPFFSDGMWRATQHYWNTKTLRFASAGVPDATGDFLVQKNDATTRDFIAYLKGEPLLKAILAGHLHFAYEERFSPTTVQYVVGGNYLFHGRELLFV